MITEVERFCAGLRMRAHQGMVDWRPLAKRGLRSRPAKTRPPAKYNTQPSDLAFCFRWQRGIAHRGVGELRVASFGRHLDRVERRQHWRHRMIGLVRVPPVIADWRGGSVDRLSVAPQVGDHMGNAVSLARRSLAAVNFDLAKARRKRKLLLSSEGLIAKDDDVVIVKRREDPILEHGR